MALTHFPDHMVAIVGLSNILLDIYNEDLLPTPVIPTLHVSDAFTDISLTARSPQKTDTSDSLPCRPLGLGETKQKQLLPHLKGPIEQQNSAAPNTDDELTPPYKAVSLPLVDRLAARDRAYGLLSGITKLGTGWNYSDAWFALARAHEESGQPDKAKEVLWWCIELEENMGVREWCSLGNGGYVL